MTRETLRPRPGALGAGLLLAAILVVGVGIVAWTRTAVHLPWGYVVACTAAASLFMSVPRWPAGFFGGALQGAVLAAVVVPLARAFYGAPPLASAAFLQSVAVWFLALAGAALLRAALLAVRRRREGAAPT